MSELLAVAVGGAVGALGRYAVVNTAFAIWGRDFPWGVLIVNVAGSFLLGLLGMLFTVKFDVPAEWRLAILVGCLGAFTTFSTFSLDTLLMLEEGHWIKAIGNIFANVVVCLLAVWLGAVLARQLA